MDKVALYFGSFNPVHVGHLSIANYVWQNEDVDEVWMVISPQNPFKDKAGLWDETVRLQILETAISGHPKIKASKVEFDLPKPSYTYNTLEELKGKYPDIQFSMIIGSDIANQIANWKKGEHLVKENSFLIYPRRTDTHDDLDLENYKIMHAPIIDISSTYIRKALNAGKDIRFLVGKDVAELIGKIKLFK